MEPLFPKNEHRNGKRRQRRWQYRDRDKELRSLMREHNRLCNVLWTAPIVELEQPYQRGWTREFRLTERARRRADADQITSLLKAINHQQYCRRGDFTFWCRKKKCLLPLPHRLRRPHLWQILREDLDPSLFKYFRHIGSGTLLLRHQIRNWIGRRWNGRLEVSCPQYFEQITEPWIITHKRVDLPETKARIAEIDELLVESESWERWLRIRGRTVSGRRACDHLSHFEKKDQQILKEIRQSLRAAPDSEPPPPLTNFSRVESTEGTTKIVPFDFPDLSFPLHQHSAA